MLLHRARLERALAMADLSQKASDEEGAVRELKLLAGEPADFHVVGASFARAAPGARQGLIGDGRLWLREGLETWRRTQPIVPAPAAGSLDEDVIAIRDVVFRPLGGGLYQPRWNGFEFSGVLPPYLLARSRVQVRLPGGRIESVEVNRQPPGLPNVLFLDADQEAFLNTLMKRLGGTATREPSSAMETPNQPIGASMGILKLFNESFPSRPGHWGGWEFFAYPIVSYVEFRDRERTKASAAVVIGYAGCTVVLEKRNGVWVALQLTNMWVT